MRQVSQTAAMAWVALGIMLAVLTLAVLVESTPTFDGVGFVILIGYCLSVGLASASGSHTVAKLVLMMAIILAVCWGLTQWCLRSKQRSCESAIETLHDRYRK